MSSPVVEAVGEDPRTFRQESTLSNSNTPTNDPSGSVSMNGNGSQPTPLRLVESHDLSSSSPLVGYDSSSPRAEIDREMTVVLHMNFFGKEHQMTEAALDLAKNLSVQGHEVYGVVLNNKPLHFDPAEDGAYG